MLTECDGDSIDLWETHKKQFATLLPVQTIVKVSTALENIDFDKALELLPARLQNPAADKSNAIPES